MSDTPYFDEYERRRRARLNLTGPTTRFGENIYGVSLEAGDIRVNVNNPIGRFVIDSNALINPEVLPKYRLYKIYTEIRLVDGTTRRCLQDVELQIQQPYEEHWTPVPGFVG